MFSPNITFTRMSASEEANLILQDIFQYDSEGMSNVIGTLCEENSIAFDWELNGDEIDDLLIENEDLVSQMYESYQCINFYAA
jgi:ethanolamine utilization protein EutQ (cupin superfamily)